MLQKTVKFIQKYGKKMPKSLYLQGFELPAYEGVRMKET